MYFLWSNPVTRQTAGGTRDLVLIPGVTIRQDSSPWSPSIGFVSIGFVGVVWLLLNGSGLARADDSG